MVGVSGAGVWDSRELLLGAQGAHVKATRSRTSEVEEESFCLERRYIAQCAETCIVLRGADLAHRKTVEDR